MKKTKRHPVSGKKGKSLPRHLRGTMLDTIIWAWHGSSSPERNKFVLQRDNLRKVSDRRDANRMYKWMARRTRMVEVVRAQLAREGAAAGA